MKAEKLQAITAAHGKTVPKSKPPKDLDNAVVQDEIMHPGTKAVALSDQTLYLYPSSAEHLRRLSGFVYKVTADSVGSAAGLPSAGVVGMRTLAIILSNESIETEILAHAAKLTFPPEKNPSFEQLEPLVAELRSRVNNDDVAILYTELVERSGIGQNLKNG